MPFKLPPPKNDKQQSEQAAYRAYINAHPYLRPVAQAIYSSAKKYGLDAVYFAALISFESAQGTWQKHQPPTGYGWAQINPKEWVGNVDQRDGHIITMDDIKNVSWNIGFGAFLFKQGLNKYGTYEDAYNKSYNNGYKGPSPFASVPKGYVPIVGTSSPQESAQTSVETSTAKQDITDPYVTIKNGKLVKTTSQGAIKVFGQPLRRSQFLSTWQNLNDLYLAYTGRPVTARAVKDILSSGKSRYQVIDILSRGPNFVGSAIWKQNSPGYEAVWKKVYGEDSTPDNAAIRYAIVNNLGADGFAQTLRDRPDYENSQEFKGNESTMSAVYTKIFGVPDANGLAVVKTATKQGQTPDEFASYLRSQPEYQKSGEFKSRALGVASALGFVTGQLPTLGEDLTGGPPVGTTRDNSGTPAGVLG